MNAKNMFNLLVYILLIMITIFGTKMVYEYCGKKVAISVLIIELVNIATYTIALLII